jgi:hypothetical protein
MEPTITLDADLDAVRARQVVAPVPDDFLVVVRRRPTDGSAGALWYVLPVEDVRRRLEAAPDEQTVGDVLALSDDGAEQARQVISPEVQDGTWTGVVVDGSRVLGYVRATRRTTRSLFPDDAPAAAPAPAPTAAPAPAPAPAPARSVPPPASMAPPDLGAPARGGGWSFPSFRLPRLRRSTTRSMSRSTDQPVATPPPGADVDLPGPVVPPAADEPHIEAFPTIDVPAEVAPGARFDVVVGLADEAPAGVAATMSPLLSVAAPEETLDLEVQVVADGFSAPEGVRRTMAVPRSDAASASVTVPLVAPAELPNAASSTAEAWRGVVEVEFSAEGVLVARAWREVVVTAQATGDGASSAEGGGLAVAAAGTTAADLTVTVCEGSDPSRLVWTFTTPHPVALPQDQVSSTLPVASAMAFAMGQVKDLGTADGTPVADNRVMGVARAVSSATPVELWEVLSAVWAVAKADQRVPSLLLVSCEAYVPWELASVEADWVVDRTLVDEDAPMVLGAQVRMGRWLPAGPRTPSGVQRPAVPPTTTIDVGRMAVVVGDYHSESGLRPLPEALEEGKTLTKDYPAVWVKGTLTEVASLLDDALTDKGEKVSPDVVHMACHGEVDPDHPAYNGIVLSDTALRMDATIVRGSALGRSTAPLVFVNACQLAQNSGDLLCDYGGLAGAFLTEGCRGFIAPLWSVDDGLAYDTAVDFYRLCLQEHVTVGEAFRRLRGRFTENAAHDQTTPLAYVFFGHPDLQLALAS